MYFMPEIVPPGASTSVHVKGDGTVDCHVPVNGQASNTHVAEQPSPLVVLPSSQSSPASIVPSPRPRARKWRGRASGWVRAFASSWELDPDSGSLSAGRTWRQARYWPANVAHHAQSLAATAESGAATRA